MDNAPIETLCPHCESTHQAMTSWLGQYVDCSICKQKFVVEDLKTILHRKNGTKECLYCAETILVKAKKCKHCGEFTEELGNRIHKPVTVEDEQTTIRQIHDYEKVSSWIWIVIGIIQVCTGYLVIIGIWNLVAAIASRKLLPKILERDSSIPSSYEPLASLIVVGILNIIFTAGLGIIAVVLDFIVRDKVLKNKHLFNRELS